MQVFFYLVDGGYLELKSLNQFLLNTLKMFMTSGLKIISVYAEELKEKENVKKMETGCN